MSLLIDQVSVQVKPDGKALTLLDQVCVSVDAGQVLAVIGPNGAGKTSLIRAVMGDVPLSQGTITLDGQALNDIPMNERARCIALLPQLSLLNFPYTAQEVVMLGRTPHQTGRQRDQQIVTELMQQLDIAHLAERLYPNLSGGEKQRVQLGRVMAQIACDDAREIGSRWLLLDEPTAALDPGHQQQLMDTVRTVAAQGVGVVMIMHDVSLAASVGDVMLALKGGQVQALGPADTLLDAQLMKAVFDVDSTVIAHPVTGKPVVLAG